MKKIHPWLLLYLDAQISAFYTDLLSADDSVGVASRCVAILTQNFFSFKRDVWLVQDQSLHFVLHSL